MLLHNLVHECLCLIVKQLDYEKQSLLCNACRELRKLRHLRLVRLRRIDVDADPNEITRCLNVLFTVAANTITRPSYLCIGPMSFVLNPVPLLPGKIHVNVNTCMAWGCAEKLEHIPTDVVHSFSIRVQNPDSMPCSSFFQTLAMECARMGVKSLKIDTISPYSNDWIDGLTAHQIPRLESLCLQNVNIEGTGTKDKLTSWLRGMPLAKLSLNNAAMHADCWHILETLTGLKRLELRNCDLEIRDAVKLDISTGLEHLGIRGSAINFDCREQAEAWMNFCDAHPALKGVEIHIKARRENFLLFLNNLKNMELECIDMLFQLERAHFVFMDISQTLQEMPGLKNVRLEQKGGADYNAIFRTAVPNARFPDLKVSGMEMEKFSEWLQNVTELSLKNLALHDDTQGLILDKIGKNKTLKTLELIDVVGSNIQNLQIIGDITEFSYVDRIYLQTSPGLLSMIHTMSKLSKLQICGRWHSENCETRMFHEFQRSQLKHLSVDFQAYDSEQRMKSSTFFFQELVNLRSLEVLELRNFDMEYGAVGIGGANFSGDGTEMTEMKSLSLYKHYFVSLHSFQVLIERFILLMPNLQTLRVSKIYDMTCVRQCLNVCKRFKNLEHLHFSLGKVRKDCVMDLDSVLFLGDYRQLQCISFDAESNASKFLISEIRNFFFQRFPLVTVTEKI